MTRFNPNAEFKYAQFRQITLDNFNSYLGKEVDVRGKLIDEAALVEFDRWAKNPNRKEDFDWRQIVKQYKAIYPKRFEIALWRNTQLIGLSVGKPAFSISKVRLDIIEGAPDKPRDIKVFTLTLGAYYIFARLLNADEVRVMNPINERVRDYYVSQGSTYVENGDYCLFKVPG